METLSLSDRKRLSLKLKGLSVRPGVFSPRHLWAICFDWIVIGGCIVLNDQFFSPTVFIVSAVFIAGRLHALMVLTHDAAHSNFSSNRALNDWVSDLLCAWPSGLDTSGYRDNHLKHHAHLNTIRDPDYLRKIGLEEWSFPKPKLHLAKELVVQLAFKGAFGWFLATKYFFDVRSGMKLVVRGLLTLAFLGLPLLDPNFLLPVGHYLFAAFVVFPVLQTLRSMAEHFGLNGSHELNASRDIKGLWIEAFLIYPHNVGFHLTHHLFPQIPFYQLARAHAVMVHEARTIGLSPHVNDSFFWGDSVLADLSSQGKGLLQNDDVKAA